MATVFTNVLLQAYANFDPDHDGVRLLWWVSSRTRFRWDFGGHTSAFRAADNEFMKLDVIRMLATILTL